jgi:broad specificity phosphatase PhoE
VTAIVSSPLERTRETAARVAAVHGLPVRIERGIREVDFGEWTDRPLAELRRLALWRTVQATPSRVRFPGGETLRGAQARAVDATERLAGEHPDGVIVLVSHADIIKAVVAHHLGLPLDLFQRLVIDPASSTVIALGHDRAPALLRMNDTSDPGAAPAAPADGDAAAGQRRSRRRT